MNLYEMLKDHPRFPKELHTYFSVYDNLREEGGNERLEEFIKFLKSVGTDWDKIFSSVCWDNIPSEITTALCEENIIGDV